MNKKKQIQKERTKDRNTLYIKENLKLLMIREKLGAVVETMQLTC